VHRVAVRLIRTKTPQFRSPTVAFQVLARKWRPQRFDDVVGQQAVTRTLRNAITSGRIAQAFVFAGSRGCGKTTTARILARALSCANGPTADPCGECEACVEIAQGRDIDVLEIDAASHTGIDNIREVVIAGLAISPVRNRYKVFIIDEVHQLSAASFNALLKSIEEPPPHVVFMMATTELHKIPDTILSRSQVFEFRTIPTTAIAQQLRRIAGAEKIEVPDTALALIARAAEGSMRDAQSALDQVLAFAGQTITVDDVSTVLGLVGRDLLFDLIEAVVEEDPPRAFALADRAVESGHDLRLVFRELSRLVRDMMVLGVDPARAGDGELAEGERERLVELARRFSREDLMRAFDLLSKAEQDIRTASHPRYHFEMVLLRWMHLRKLVPLADLLEQMGGAPSAGRVAPTATRAAPAGNSTAPAAPRVAPAREPAAPATNRLAPTPEAAAPATGQPASKNLKDALLAEIRSAKSTLYNIAVAMAQRIDVTENRITFTFAPNQSVARMQLEQNREWIQSAAQKLAGRPIHVVAVQGDAAPSAAGVENARVETPAEKAAPRDLKAEAMSSSAVQAVLDVFPAEIREVEELK
jgi:DNA polymerase-3 subunit gamma/tau